MLCDNCDGACCRWTTIPILSGYERPLIEWAAARGLKRDGNLIYVPHTCPKLLEGKCTIHDKKPQLCKRFKVGGIECTFIRRMENLE